MSDGRVNDTPHVHHNQWFGHGRLTIRASIWITRLTTVASTILDLVSATAFSVLIDVEHGKAAAAILALAARVNADLIVLGARKSSFWLTYVNTGVLPAILAEANCPVLTVC